MPFRIDGDIGEICAGGVLALAGEHVFGKYFYADLERSVKRTVDAGFEHDQLADENGIAEVEMIHRGGDHMAAAVTMRGDGSRDVDQVHDAASKDVAENVGVLGEHDFDHLGARFAYAPSGGLPGAGWLSVLRQVTVFRRECVARAYEATVAKAHRQECLCYWRPNQTLRLRKLSTAA